MKIKRIIYLVIIPALFVVSAALHGIESEIVLDSGFFRDFNGRQLIQRDELFDEMIDKIVIGRGKITGISGINRYKKKYRITIESSDSEAYNQKFTFYLFLENKDTIDLLTLDSKFEFKGQLAGYTPLGSKRNEYILDVIMMDGSTLIE